MDDPKLQLSAVAPRGDSASPSPLPSAARGELARPLLTPTTGQLELLNPAVSCSPHAPRTSDVSQGLQLGQCLLLAPLAGVDFGTKTAGHHRNVIDRAMEKALPVLLVAGYSNQAEEFEESLGEFREFLRRIDISGMSGVQVNYPSAVE